MRVFKSNHFIRYARSQGLTDDELWHATTRAVHPDLDLCLGEGLFRQRIPRPATRHRLGYCSILTYRTSGCAVVLYGFPRNKPDELDAGEVMTFRALVDQFVRLGDDDIATLTAHGKFIEVHHG